MGGTGRPSGKPFFLHRQRRHPELPKIPTYLPARGRFVGGQQSGLAGCKPPPLFTRGASSCSSQGRRQGEPRGASPRPSAPTYLPMYSAVSCNAPLLGVPLHCTSMLPMGALRGRACVCSCHSRACAPGLASSFQLVEGSDNVQCSRVLVPVRPALQVGFAGAGVAALGQKGYCGLPLLSEV